jgi:L-alanine-DL-glutamate epimerase-like enolase superfamily enzyme
LQPYTGMKDHVLCEYPVELTPLAYDLTSNHLDLNRNGEITLPEAPGLGMTLKLETIKKYLVQTQIIVNNKVLYETPTL